VECESVTLSRSVPPLLKYVIRPIINRIAKESLERTLESLRARIAQAIKPEGIHTTPVARIVSPEIH
jgi:hypothetical protein